MSVRTPPSSPTINGAENRHTMKIKPDVNVMIYTKISSSWKCELTFDKIGLAVHKYCYPIHDILQSKGTEDGISYPN